MLIGYSYGSNNLLWFISAYLIGGFIRKYPTRFERSARFYALVALVCAAIIFVSVCVFMTVEVDNQLLNMFVNKTRRYSYENSLVGLTLAVSLFLMFKNMREFHSNIVNIISSASLGIYLLSESDYIRQKIFGEWFDCPAHFATSDMYIYYFMMVFCIYFGCLIIELIRKYTLEKLIQRAVDPIADSLHGCYVSLVNRAVSYFEK